ncbi:chromosome-associated kinesin KIF4-like [Condylostylus longicornis]|uniref:chromosome-associated kinesin KIF4-like n=1 Tax=Condylostylus longicornis TaxID=2530218 RepID=UPI00244E48CC|nr:chromosome-associated kinesin KIF4-like [Condylostylus longicornis]
MSDADCVKVALRIRPLVKTEIDKGCQEIVSKINGESQVFVKNHDSYTFNYVFGKNESQIIVYEEAVKSMISKLFKGYNVTILAYGQTGSGKTHTMGTSFDGEKSFDMGVIPRSIYDIFNKISEFSKEYDISVTCSFMELYQETLYDLLSNSTRDQSSVDIREDTNKGIIIPGLTEVPISSANEAIDCLIKGSSGRAVGATAMNEQSSRSHAIFTINVNMKKDEITSMTTSKFNLVDLAGSERSKKTKATGDRFKEGVNINKGLLALGNVISALGSGQNSYVCYRDSKLTRLLQDSLGGNSITLMIACISPADYNLDETISTLRYADRARKIKNKPIVNQDPQHAEINKLNNIIQNLRLQLLGKQDFLLANSENTGSEVSEDILALKKKNNELVEINQKLRQQLQTTLNDVTEIETRASIAEETNDKLLIKFNELKKILLEQKNGDQLVNVEIFAKIEELDQIFKQNQEELMSQKSENHSINDVTFCVGYEDAQHSYDRFTTKQLEINDELRKINRELAIKESYHQKVAINLTKFCDYEGGNENLIKETENKIQILEAEKNDLVEKLKSVKENVTAKISEERRKRLYRLEQEIIELKKKITQQDRILKVREKETLKIASLNNEIQQMKAAKVNLIKAMRKEAESFRQWKLNREKQLTQLKEKDCKRRNEMARMEALHNKQKNVLKRKVEEAMAINKRLKDVLDKQKQVQLKRHATTNGQSGKMDQILTLIDHELELILSVVDAQISLDQLMEDRAAVNQRLKEIKIENPDNKKEIRGIEDDLALRNAQIEDMQQKIISSDLTSKIKVICEGLSSLTEARGALKHLFNVLIELRKECALKSNKIEEYKSAYEMTEEKISELKRTVEENENKYRKEISNAEKCYEEKIAVLLRELSKVPNELENQNDSATNERLKIQEETLDKIDVLRWELENYKMKCNEYEKLLQAQKQKNLNQLKPNKIKIEDNEIITDEYILLDDSLADEEYHEDSFSHDPDWRRTPMFKKSKRAVSLKKSSISQEMIAGIKRNSDGMVKCGCKTNCSTKRCGCRNNEAECTERCSCSLELCRNKSIVNGNDADAGSVDITATDSIFKKEKENIDSNRGSCKSNISNSSIDLFENTALNTPKKIKCTLGTEENKNDVTTPKYPFESKKRPSYYQ